MRTCAEGEHPALAVDGRTKVAAAAAGNLGDLVHAGQPLGLGIGLGRAAHPQLALPAAAPRKAVAIGRSSIDGGIAACYIQNLSPAGSWLAYDGDGMSTVPQLHATFMVRTHSMWLQAR